MKTTIGVILGVIIGAVIVIAVVVWLVSSNLFPNNRQSSASGVPASSPSPSIIVSSPAPSSKPPSISSSPLNSPTNTTPNVNFNLNITNVSTSGLSATVNAQLTNTGKNDAHNVQAKVEVFSQGSKISVGGDTTLNIGTIKAGETITRQAVLSFSLFDGPKLMQNGATFNLTISSDEKTQTLTYDYHP